MTQLHTRAATAARLRAQGFSVGKCRRCGGVRTPFTCATCSKRDRKYRARKKLRESGQGCPREWKIRRGA